MFCVISLNSKDIIIRYNVELFKTIDTLEKHWNKPGVCVVQAVSDLFAETPGVQKIFVIEGDVWTPPTWRIVNEEDEK